MNFDDTARFFGPSEKLWPELFAKGGPKKLLRPGAQPFSDYGVMICPECRVVMYHSTTEYCPSCKPKSVSEITVLCRDCRKVVVEGICRYCERCALKRKLASTRESK